MVSGPRRSETLAADNYEWPFDLVLKGDTPESIEGLDDTWLVYRLKATIDRGILAQNIITRRHVRVVRTLDTAASELTHEMVDAFGEAIRLSSLRGADYPQHVD